MIIAVIVGLVAVVLFVLMVVAIGMRSMNRRESNLPPERLRKMAEQAEDPNAKRPGRPAEETFFESFPEGFDAFQEPERATARLRPGGGRPASRPAGRPGGRPGPRGKQAASSRGRRGVDEWGDADDYDDDYWSRVRADDGAFGGTIAARVGVSRPDVAAPDSASAGDSAGSGKPRPGKEKEPPDPNAATVQAPLPRRSPGLTDRADAGRAPAPSSSAGATERTVTFSAPVPPPPAATPPAAASGSAADVLGALGTPQPPSRGRGSRPDPADPLGVADSTRAKPRRRTTDSGDAGRTPPSRATDSRRAGSARGAERPGAPRPDHGRADRTSAGRSDAPRADAGPFTPGRPAGHADPLPSSGTRDPLSGNPLSTGPMAGGPFVAGAIASDPLSSGPLSSASTTGGSAAGPVSGSRRSAAGGFGAGRPSAGAYEPTRAAAPGPAGSGTTAGPTGPFPATPSYGAAGGPLGTGSATAGTGDLPAGGSWPAQPAYPAAGSYDILDEPVTPAPGPGSGETWKSSDYQRSSYDGYTPREDYPAEPAYPAGPPAPSTPSASSYEVRPGWATIDDSDAAIGTPPAGGPPSGASSGHAARSRRDLPSPGRGNDSPPGPGQGGYDPGHPSGTGASSPPWPQPPQNTGGSWPSYSELYGTGGPGPDQSGQPDQPDQSSQASPSRGGHRRPTDTDYPDYYR